MKVLAHADVLFVGHVLRRLTLMSPQILIVTSTAFAGVLLLNYQQDYAEWLLPLIIVCLFSFLVAHCFLSIFEIVVDVLFLCFAIDTKYNDGTPGKEFFMDKALMVRQASMNLLELLTWRRPPGGPGPRHELPSTCGRLRAVLLIKFLEI